MQYLTPVLLGLVRHVLTAIGGYLVARGLITTEDAAGLSGATEVIVGAIVFILGALWSALQKRWSGSTRPLLSIALATIGAALVFASPNGASAQARNCAPHDVLTAYLADSFGESRRAVALAHDGTAVEVFAAQETGTWSIVVTAPGGNSCLVSAGTDYQTVEQRPEDVPDT